MSDSDNSHQTDHEVEEHPVDEKRRRAMAVGAVALGTGLGVAVAVPATGYLISPAMDKTPLIKKRLNVSHVPMGKPTEVKYEVLVKDSWRQEERVLRKAWIYKYEEEVEGSKVVRVRAYNPVCTHLGCTYAHMESDGNFMCPCHGGVFSYEGDVIGGPPGRPLDQYLVMELDAEGNEIELLDKKLTEDELDNNRELWQDRLKNATLV